MRFKNWLEAVVSSENLAEALKKTLEMRVEGEWEFTFPKDATRGDSVKIAGKLRNEKTSGASYFFLSAYAIKEQPLFSYDSLSGNNKLRITASFLYIDGKGGYSNLGVRSNEHAGDDPKSNYGQPIKSPFWLADWVNSMVSRFNGFNGGGGEEGEPEWTPSSDPARLVGV
jgi:hypothetical protein